MRRPFEAAQLVALGLVAATALTSCGTPAGDPLDDCRPGAPCQDGPLLVAAKVEFLSEIEPGITRGFNLDGRNGPIDDFECNYGDHSSPDGTPGIDNQLARILPVLASAVGDALPSLVQNSINEGGLLALAEVLDHPTDSNRAHIVFHRATGTPLLDTTGLLLEAQSYRLTEEPPLGICRDAEWKDGILVGSDCDLRLSVVIFGHTYAVTLRDSRFEMRLSDDRRSGTLLMGGSLAMDDLMGIVDVIYEIGDVPHIAALVAELLPPFADLVDPETGECDRITASVEFTFRSGYAMP